MATEIPDWLRTTEDEERAAKRRAELRHLSVLRDLLARDYLAHADLVAAQRDLAKMAKVALRARETIVALYHDDAGIWSGVTSDGTALADSQISNHGSRSILDRVRSTLEPILTTGERPIPVESPSLLWHEVDSVLAVPLFWWDVKADQRSRRFGGCLYAHRISRDDPFTENDVELVLDITRIAQPNLNLLRYVEDLQRHLEASHEALHELRQAAAQEFRLGKYHTFDPWFAENVLGSLRRVAHADRVGLLILGPTGSGKTYLAEAYHYECRRSKGPFVTLDCAQVTSSETLASELFGYAPHSGYANAPRTGRLGKAQLANGGTLFIDEIACLPSDLQQRLLRLIQTGAFSPLGSSEEVRVDIQIIAATNGDLARLVAEGRFREDLMWRISEMTIQLPSLDRRPADIAHLAERFLERAKERFGRSDITGFDRKAINALLNHNWADSGNIRGLEHTINRSVLLAPPTAPTILSEFLKLDAAFNYGRERRISGEPEGAAVSPRVASPAGASLAGTATPLAVDLPGSPARELLARKIREHAGVTAAIACDPEVCAALGYEARAMPNSSLWVKVRELGLAQVLEQARREQRRVAGHERVDLDVIKEAIRAHGSGTIAAAALGVTRDSMVWQLRKAGLSVRDVLAGR